MSAHPAIFFLDQVSSQDKDDLSPDFLSLAELHAARLPVLEAFALGHTAFTQTVQPLAQTINSALSSPDLLNYSDLKKISSRLTAQFRSLALPPGLPETVASAYDRLANEPYVSLRLTFPGSFLGLFPPIIYTRGDANLINAVKQAWASLFSPPSLYTLTKRNLTPLRLKPTLIVQLLPQAVYSGSLTTSAPGQPNLLAIEAIHGLPPPSNLPPVLPDQYLYDPAQRRLHHFTSSPQQTMYVLVGNSYKAKLVNKVSIALRKLTPSQLKQLGQLALSLKKHFFLPQQTNWLFAGNKFYFSATSSLTKPAPAKTAGSSLLFNNLHLLGSGTPLNPGVVSGPAKFIKPFQTPHIEKGDILITKAFPDKLLPYIDRVAGLITQSSPTFSLQAQVSQELNLPSLTAFKHAAKLISSGQIITLNATTGHVYLGSPTKQSSQSTGHKSVSLNTPTATKLMLDVTNPKQAAHLGQHRLDGIGIFRPDQLILDYGIHPKQLIADRSGHLFTDHLALHLKRLCQSFSHRPVFYALSSLTSDQYRPLKGGSRFEPVEDNPLLGLRGALRHLTDPKTLNLELGALKTVRNRYNLKNLHLLITFVRTPRELQRLKALIASQGLLRSPSFRLHLSLDLPSNLFDLKSYVKIGFDGITIGFDSISMLTLGLDPDNQETSHLITSHQQYADFSAIFTQTIKSAKSHHLTTSLHGQTFKPDQKFINLLIKSGITSISTPPSLLEDTKQQIYNAEHRAISS